MFGCEFSYKYKRILDQCKNYFICLYIAAIVDKWRIRVRGQQ